MTDEKNLTEQKNDNLDECGEEKQTVKCKFFHHDPYMTPNNYDLYFNYNGIPANIRKETGHDLLRRLQKTLPLSKILHLNLETTANPQNNQINLTTFTRLRYKREKDGVKKTIVVKLK